jgi:hypothetical protein
LFEEDDLAELDIPSIAPSVGKMSVSIVAFKPVSRARGEDVGGGGAASAPDPSSWSLLLPLLCLLAALPVARVSLSNPMLPKAPLNGITLPLGIGSNGLFVESLNPLPFLSPYVNLHVSRLALVVNVSSGFSKSGMFECKWWRLRLRNTVEYKIKNKTWKRTTREVVLVTHFAMRWYFFADVRVDEILFRVVELPTEYDWDRRIVGCKTLFSLSLSTKTYLSIQNSSSVSLSRARI